MTTTPATPTPANGALLDEMLTKLATYVDADLPGWSRPVFSEPYARSRPYLRRLMKDAGLQVTTDAAGNTIGRLPGRNPALKPLMTGSHTDTVRGGGRFDGILGVLGGIVAARAIAEAGGLERDLFVVDFLGEEPNDYGVSCVGSRALAGHLTADHLANTDASGTSLREAMASFGLDPEGALAQAWQPDSLHAYVELHIEQGPQLEAAQTQIGLVTGIAGIARFVVHYAGQPDHAGGTPMSTRRDALMAAAEGLLELETRARQAPVHGVATVGHIDAFPGSLNVVPGNADVWGEMRSIDAAWLRDQHTGLGDELARLSTARNVDGAVQWLTYQDPVPAIDAVRAVIRQATEELGFSFMDVPSGAGHDAAHVAELGPMGMIFVPSVAGRSHCPEEWTDADDCLRGVQVLVATLQRLDSLDSLTPNP